MTSSRRSKMKGPHNGIWVTGEDGNSSEIRPKTKGCHNDTSGAARFVNKVMTGPRRKRGGV